MCKADQATSKAGDGAGELEAGKGDPVENRVGVKAHLFHVAGGWCYL